MRKSLKTRLKTTAMIAAALAFCAPAWSDVRVFTSGPAARRICYCDCDAKPGAALCMRMCELAKYENRSWANSCHKKAESEPVRPSTEPGARSAKNNRVQQARR